MTKARQKQAQVPSEDADVPQSLFTWGDKEAVGEVVWLWPGAIPAGYITLLEGRKSVGKSCIAAAIAAAVTGGPALPDWTGPRRGKVLWLAAEDDWKQVTLARLVAAGAVVGSVAMWEVRTPMGSLRRPILPDDLSLLEAAVPRLGVALLVIDPAICAVSCSLNINVPQQCRAFTTPLQEVCTRTGLACLLVRHVKKDATGDAREAGLGGVELANAARSLLRADEHPHQSEKLVLSSVACNYGATWETRVYSFQRRPNGPPKIKWQGTVALDTEAIMEGRGTEADRDEWNDADRLLAGCIRSGCVRIKEIERIATDAGVTPRMLRRAKARLKVRTIQKMAGADHWWEWRAPKGGWPDYLTGGGVSPQTGAPGAPAPQAPPQKTSKTAGIKGRRPRRPRFGGTPPQAPPKEEGNGHAR